MQTSMFYTKSTMRTREALHFKPKIVGVNNRDLRQFTTDLAISENLIPKIPEGIIKVSESGILISKMQCVHAIVVLMQF